MSGRRSMGKCLRGLRPPALDQPRQGPSGGGGRQGWGRLFLVQHRLDQLADRPDVIGHAERHRTLASAGQLHLTFNAIEERHCRRFLYGTRAHLRQAAFMLIWLFLGAVALLIVKPLVRTSPTVTSITNGIGLLILLWEVLLMVEITQTVFAIKPALDDLDDGSGPSPL